MISEDIQEIYVYIKKTQVVETRIKQTKGMLIHRRWVRSGTERMGDGDQTDIDI